MSAIVSEIKEGTVVKIHSLKSNTGRKLNGKRALVIIYQPKEERFRVRVEGEEIYRALKAPNLQPLDRLPIPTSRDRGFADVDIHGQESTSRLCQLLLYDIPGEFKVSDTVFTGYAHMAFDRMDQRKGRTSNFNCFYASQMEQMGGVLALGNLCRECEEAGTESVVFALLEGNEMYLDTLIQTIACTGEIIDGDNCGEDYEGRSGFGVCGVGPILDQLTPDQDTNQYIRTIEEGPMLILQCVSLYSFAPALWAALSRSKYYHLLIQRLLRWSAREVIGTIDGKSIGRTSRKILKGILPDLALFFKNPVSEFSANKILEDASTMLLEPSDVNRTSLLEIFVPQMNDGFNPCP